MTHHARERAWDRYDRLVITPDEGADLEDLIRSGDCKAVFLRDMHQGRKLYAVRFKYQWLPVVYTQDPEPAIVTVLPKQALRGFWMRLRNRERDHGILVDEEARYARMVLRFWGSSTQRAVVAS